MTQFGVNVNRKGWTGTIAQIYQANAAAYDGKGLGPHCAFFSGATGNWSDTLNHYHVMGWGRHPNEKVPMFCAKVHTNSSLDEVIEYFGQRKQNWLAVFNHEVQSRIMHNELSVKKYRDTLEAMAARRKHHLRYGKYMRIVGNSSGYWIFKHPNRVRQRGCDVLTLFRGTPVDVVTVDHYWRRLPLQGPGYLRTYNAGFDQLAADARRLGLPWGVGEMGLDVRLGSARPELLRAIVVHLRKRGAQWATYWEGGGQAEYRLRGYPEALEVWKAAIASNRD